MNADVIVTPVGMNGDLLYQDTEELLDAIAQEEANLLAAEANGDPEAAWDAFIAITGYERELAGIDRALDDALGR